MMKLYYFGIAGRGEPIRLLLHHAKVPFEDVKIPFDKWAEEKTKFEGGQLPVLEVDGKRYAQSLAILEFLGIKYGYTPTDPMQSYNALAIISACEDLGTKVYSAFSKLSLYDEVTKKKLQEDMAKIEFPMTLSFIEKKLAENCCKDFLVGNKYSIADFRVLGMYASWVGEESRMKIYNDLTCIPLLKAYIARRLKDFEFYYKKPCAKPKLYYFDGAGRGEMIRLLLKHAKVDFEDVRIKYENWPKMKDQFALKQVPVWECCGEQMPQTDAIMHHLSLKHGYLPLDPEKMYKVLFAANTVKDFFEGFVKFFYGGLAEEMKKKKEEEYYTKTVPLIFEILEKRLKENESQVFMVGNQYTMADFYMLGAAKWLIFSPSTEKNYAKALEAAPLLKGYFKKRLEDFPA